MKEKIAMILSEHQGTGFAFRNAESGALYNCTCGRRYSSLPDHQADILERILEQ